ncbi:DGQHR domain-containing protein [Rhodoferax sp.]|uniref:DGQHR domain-containing protein n=1 Tax=Rhodoferax sp. TaxID=50421 RepID=UPI00272F4506|nr:DGQHR domain-containing protein [Rhodoferax sp.]MDP1527879.1 DGQHR domain-containing protein [Rhodoferax sp.]MDP1944508.1 DGQHR domain-containing protein [Rhodoferax sp.]MDP2440156.1 DGQHR domain-containing protein [Rhodoferax sp.]MDZ4208866.1 DGQHR domain-containing protein [Rhodoferax sp.]
MKNQKIPAIYCKQWLADWDSYPFPEENERRKPPAELLIFSMSAMQLRKLSGVYVRKRDGVDATGIQRMHEKDRSLKIAEYVRAGYPYGDLSAKQKADPTNDSLRKPGWLPTAIVINFLQVGDQRRGKSVDPGDAIEIEDVSGVVNVVLPAGTADNTWEPKGLSPIEIIDGQHRLFAFDEASQLPDDFELPVVAFHGLDIGWQAYLFWSINVSPKKINPSHAYDLFPLLRTQDWLETVSSVHVYREARAQELTDLLYRHPSSPWKGRINMLGERKSGWVSQAGWVQAIYNSFLSPGQVGRSRKGLFAANLSTTVGPLNWSRPQQVAFLIFIWQQLQIAIHKKVDGWSLQLRSLTPQQIDFEDGHDLAFLGSKTLLNQEQGVRGMCLACNDVFYRAAIELRLDDWQVDDIDAGETRSEDIDRCLTDLSQQPFSSAVSDAVIALADFDWRSSDVPDLTPEEELKKSGFRGTGGYGRMRQELLELLSRQNTVIGKIAGQIIASEAA